MIYIDPNSIYIEAPKQPTVMKSFVCKKCFGNGKVQGKTCRKCNGRGRIEKLQRV